MKNPKASSDGPRILQLGFKLYNLEIFFENKASIISFKKPDSGNDTINTSDSILFGVGIVF